MSEPLALPAGPPAKIEDAKKTTTVVPAQPLGPPRQSRHDSKYYCTCPPETFEGHEKISEVPHPKTCPVWEFDDWKHVRCEWDPKKKGWFYTCKCEPESTEMECKICNVKKYYEKGPWVPIETGAYSASSWQGSSSYYGGGNYTQKCRHMEQEVTYPDGTRVFASSELSHEIPKGVPDFALYAYDGWRPRSLATMIPWKDYGLPTCPWPVAAGAIKEAHGLAKDGWSIEVGCAGGHGRTGTILACMAVLSGVPAINAVDWVQEHYCEHAVEGEVQEWWVLWFECWHLGIPTPQTLPEKPKPEPAPPKKAATTTTKMPLTKAEKKAAKEKAKNAKKVVKDALADGSPLTMDQYAEYLKTSPDSDDPEEDLAWDDLVGDEDDAAAYLAWQARCTGTSGGATDDIWDAAEEWIAKRDAAATQPDDTDPINWHSEDPETEERWARAWDLIEEGPWPTGETDEEFWERVNAVYDDLCEQEDEEDETTVPKGLDAEDEPIEASGLGIFRSFFGLR